jgi:hypothetical protein
LTLRERRSIRVSDLSASTGGGERDVLQHQGADTRPVSDTQARRVLALRRMFLRELRHKPTLLQSTLIQRASVMTAKAELGCIDPATSATDAVRLDNAAHRARQAAFDAIAAKPKQLGPDSLRDYAREKKYSAVPA